MNHRKIFFWSITVALAGFLFGFDTVVISGADLSLQQLWPRGEVFHGVVIIASALWGTVLGAILGGIPTDKLGRKKTLLWIGVFYFISAVGSALANDPWVFAFFRFVGGLAVGASTIAAPAYVSEIAPAHNRGRLVALYQFNIVFGILIAFVSNYLLSGLGENGWRWMIGVEAIPAFMYTLMVFTVPESPRWLLVKKKDRVAAAATMRLIDPTVDPEVEIDRILSDQALLGKKESIFNKAFQFPLMLAFLVAFFNQFSGINAFLYYAPRIFKIAGLEDSAALLSSIGVGITNMIFTLIGLSLIDKLGRKQLLYIGSVGYIISLSLVAMAFWMNWQGMAVPIFLFMFIAAHAIGQGTVIWVFISEIFPNHLRASGQSFGSSVHWVLAAAIPSAVPWLFAKVGAAPVFVFFAFMMVLQLIFVWKMMPETKGVSLEDLEMQMTKAD
ncbi:MAG: sugar porter family MFS transporter [Lewinellaceae bacterium]|nr:sugar porter family MFS transporter [Lewinellaceae bacterium]